MGTKPNFRPSVKGQGTLPRPPAPGGLMQASTSVPRSKEKGGEVPRKGKVRENFSLHLGRSGRGTNSSLLGTPLWISAATNPAPFRFKARQASRGTMPRGPGARPARELCQSAPEGIWPQVWLGEGIDRVRPPAAVLSGPERSATQESE